MNGRLGTGIVVAWIAGVVLLLGGCSHPAPREECACMAPVAVTRARRPAPCAVVRQVAPRPSVSHVSPVASPIGAVVAPAPIAAVQPTPAVAIEEASTPARPSSQRHGRPGFEVFEEQGRLWVFREGSPSLDAFLDKGEPAKRVTRVGVGPDDMTVMSDDGGTIDAYLAVTRYAVPGFNVEMKDGRLWVFEKDSDAYRAYREHGEPAKRLTRIGQGPHGRTVIGPDAETLDTYLAQARYGRDGFATFLIDGRLWVFREGSPDLDQFRRIGEPAKRVTRVGSGPDGLSMVGPDGETLDAYMATWR